MMERDITRIFNQLGKPNILLREIAEQMQEEEMKYYHITKDGKQVPVSRKDAIELIRKNPEWAKNPEHFLKTTGSMISVDENSWIKKER